MGRASNANRHGKLSAAALLVAAGLAGGIAQAESRGDAETAAQALHPSAKGHGWISIGYQDTYVNGLRTNDSTVLDVGEGTMRALHFDLEYFVSDAWSVQVGIPYLSKVFRGSPHCPTSEPPQCRGVPALNPPHPESRFQDDGHYHGTWQDWNIGAAWHATVHGNYLLTPSLTLWIPSHDYVFFSNAAAGQRIWRVEPSLELAHQFDFTNLYYRARYSYIYTEKVLDTRLNHHRLELELGYFFNERFTLRGFTIGKKGQGYTLQQLGPLTAGRTNDYWYHHDQLAKHNFAEVGIGADYHLAGPYTVSAAYHKMIWGQSVINFRHAFEVRLTRDF